MMGNKYNFCKKIYEEQALKTGIKDFQNIAHITYEIDDKNRYYVVTFEACIIDIDKIKKEFGNYILIETMRRKGIQL